MFVVKLSRSRSRDQSQKQLKGHTFNTSKSWVRRLLCENCRNIINECHKSNKFGVSMLWIERNSAVIYGKIGKGKIIILRKLIFNEDTPNIMNMKHIPLIYTNNFISPQLHIKLELIQNFVKALDENAFLYLKNEEIFVRPQIRTTIKNENFNLHFPSVEKHAQYSFETLVKNVLGTNKTGDYGVNCFHFIEE